ncbi:hypothetical protein BT93_G1536 [Corymbia citriodora subsp. variegata]|nr:hypothetical protein BT93_G1536 [Corymbia citriodora subsp. variegata]
MIFVLGFDRSGQIIFLDLRAGTLSSSSVLPYVNSFRRNHASFLFSHPLSLSQKQSTLLYDQPAIATSHQPSRPFTLSLSLSLSLSSTAMSAAGKAPSPPLLFSSVFLLVLSLLTSPSASDTNSFVFGGCSQVKYLPGSPYENGVNSILTSFVNNAMFASYNNFTIPTGSIPAGTTSADTIYGVFQCRGDLDQSTCSSCIARAVSQVGTLCTGACGGALQLDGCFVKYDNSTFLGVEDKTVVIKKCGPGSDNYDSNALARRDAVLGYIGASNGDGGAYKYYRDGWSGDMRAVAQCVQDLSPGECQDCLGEAIGQLKSNCGAARWGDMFLAKCYVRYSEGGDHSHADHDHNDDDEIEKTLAILIGLIAGVTLVIVFLSFLGKVCETAKEGK